MQVTKYHILDDHGKTVVDYLLTKEYARVLSSSKKEKQTSSYVYKQLQFSRVGRHGFIR